MYKLILTSFITFLFISSCKDGTDQLIPITDMFPLANGNEWEYQFVDKTFNDTLDFFADFDNSQLSDNSEKAIFEIYSIETSLVIILTSKNGGVCIDILPQSFEEAKENLNSQENSCGGFLKYPINSGDSYSYSYSTNSRNYTYDVEVSEELVQIDSRSIETVKYTIPSGSQPMRDITEVFFNPELGIVKMSPEFEKGSEPTRYYLLKETNF